MLPLENRSRKRSFKDLKSLPNDIESQGGSHKADGNETPDPVICLTGFGPEEKDDYHRIIERLGGRFTRNLDSSVNTHLVAQSPEGLKYEAALSIPSIEVVSPGWLDACAKERRWVFTKDYRLDSSAASMAVEELSPANGTIDQSFHLDLDRILVDNPKDTATTLFGDCRIFFVGFDEETQAKLSRLLRRGMATICWDLDDDITHVILRDGLDEQVRDGARLLMEQHPNYPAIVSPSWTIKSWEKGELEDPERFTPKYVKKAPKVTKPKTTKKSEASSLFRGSLFAFLRIAPPHEVVDFDRDELEGISVSNGGQLLSAEHVAALRSDSARGAQRRQCYVVCWGSFDKSNLSIHSLVSQLKREDIAEVVLVTPVWLKTCAAESKVIPVARCPEMFSPDSTPLRKIGLVSQGKKMEEEEPSIRITVTGYSGIRRKALKFLIEAMGAYYDDSLRPCTTHLICREPSGPKYEKAKEWKIHVVSIEWLYHVAEFGYQGAKKRSSKESGCELTFQSSVVQPKI